jgi:hypothetical protein
MPSLIADTFVCPQIKGFSPNYLELKKLYFTAKQGFKIIPASLSGG